MTTMPDLASPTAILAQEFSEAFVQAMRDRVLTSYYKYGAAADAFPQRVNALKSALQRLDQYLDDHNTEWLVDAANFLMFEFMFPSQPGAHFHATDSDESPGRWAWEGQQPTTVLNVGLREKK